MKRFLIFLGTFILLFFITFRTLILNLSSDLIDWLDYPFIVWTMNQNIEKIKSLNFANFFETNAFYPNKLTLLFSDILLPQSLIALPFSYFTNNPILVFNIVFVITFVLNFIASFLFWQQIFKKDWLAFFGSLFTVFSPFTHLLIGHFQMLSFWPFFFALYFLFKKKPIVTGLFLAAQFLASVYLAIFLLFTIGVYYLVHLLTKQFNSSNLKDLILIIGIFILIDGIFIKGYLDAKKTYQIKRDLGEYVNYSAHLSDYLFTTNIRSAVHQSSIFRRWNSFDQHKIGENASFPGFLLAVLAALSLFSASRTKKDYIFSLKLDQTGLFFFLIMISGLIFSLGPRLSFNGTYVQIPSIYSLFIKIPFFDTIRSLARWSFIFYLGIIYFALFYLKQLNKRWILPFIFILFFLEYIPVNIQTHAESYIDNRYRLLRDICSKDKKVLAEFPTTHLAAGKNIIGGLNYISKVQLASVYHNCYIVNGYSGYDLPSILNLQRQIDVNIATSNIEGLAFLLGKAKVNIIKFNKNDMGKEVKKNYQSNITSEKMSLYFTSLGEGIYLKK